MCQKRMTRGIRHDNRSINCAANIPLSSTSRLRWYVHDSDLRMHKCTPYEWAWPRSITTALLYAFDSIGTLLGTSNHLQSQWNRRCIRLKHVQSTSPHACPRIPSQQDIWSVTAWKLLDVAMLVLERNADQHTFVVLQDSPRCINCSRWHKERTIPQY